jgi:hypothetical protein
MNTSGVPGQLVQAERQLGFDSRLVTLYRDRRNYFEDICLNLPFIDFSGTKFLKRWVSAPQKLTVDNVARIPDSIPLTWQPHSFFESFFVAVRDRIWRAKVEKAIRDFHLDQFDVYQLDGGLDFYRNPHFIPHVKKHGAKLICCYTGSDLRTRGVIKEIDGLSDLNVTVEFDHLRLHPDIHHVFFPFDTTPFLTVKRSRRDKIRIGHAPTQWKAKGSDVIVPILQQLEKELKAEMVLIQNLPYSRAIEIKKTCDIFVDQIGDLGYGINSLEALAMGIPTCSCLAPGFGRNYHDHPFIEINGQNLYEQLCRLIKDPGLCHEKGQQGREWVQRYHDARQIVRTIHRLAGLAEEADADSIR